jgi:hypothetical protein
MARARRDKMELRAWFSTLKQHPCLDCGVSYPPWIMQFDHRPDEEKVADLARMVSRGFARWKIEAEIKKCDLVCANCHAERTHLRL